MHTHTAWKSVLHMPCKCAFCRSPQWSRFRRGTIPPRWVKAQIPLREFIQPFENLGPFFFNNKGHRFITQVDLPSLGRDCHHTVNLLVNVHIHRSEGQLPSWKYTRFEVRLFAPSPSNLGIGTLNAIVLPFAAISCLLQGSSLRHTAQAAMPTLP
jgi:hypothetical protein